MTKVERLVFARAKLNELLSFDADHWANGVFCGIDEAGRGPIAGPVYAAAVVLPPKADLVGLNDSKKLSSKQRQSLYEQIISVALSVGIGMVSPEEIDSINILRASLKAMELAVCAFATPFGEPVIPSVALVDGTIAPNITPTPITIVRGDGKSACIAAASIVAKVVRDGYMQKAAAIYPEYNFDKHKGYGTASHYEAVRKHGLCPIHRKSFLKGVSREN